MRFRLFWIDESITEGREEIVKMIQTINPIAYETEDPGGPQTLHIVRMELVAARYGSDLLCISDQCLHEMRSRSITNVDFIRPNHQYLSVCLVNTAITSTGFDIDELKEMAKEISLLSGDFVKSFDSNTDIVIASTTASQKVYQAMEASKPVVSVSWLHACFESRVKIPVDSFRVSPFFGCKMSSTDLTPRQRKEVSRIVKRGGGQWSDSYDETVTFLIAHMITSSKKIQLALFVNMPIVIPSWITTYPETIVSPLSYTLNWWCFEKNKHCIFQGISFTIDNNLPNQEPLKIAIEANGGHLTREGTYIVCLDGCGQDHENAVSPRWIWRCVSERKLMDIGMSQVFKPLHFKPPVKGVTNQVIALIDFDDSTRLTMADTLRDLGATVFYSFSKNATMGIISSHNSKIEKMANEYGVPIVNASWFAELVRTGCVPEERMFEPQVPTQRFVDLRQLCNTLKRTPSKAESLYEEIQVNVTQLESFTQASPKSDNNSLCISYGNDIEVPLRVSDDTNDPLLSVFDI